MRKVLLLALLLAAPLHAQRTYYLTSTRSAALYSVLVPPAPANDFSGPLVDPSFAAARALGVSRPLADPELSEMLDDFRALAGSPGQLATGPGRTSVVASTMGVAPVPGRSLGYVRLARGARCDGDCVQSAYGSQALPTAPRGGGWITDAAPNAIPAGSWSFSARLAVPPGVSVGRLVACAWAVRLDADGIIEAAQTAVPCTEGPSVAGDADGRYSVTFQGKGAAVPAGRLVYVELWLHYPKHVAAPARVQLLEGTDSDKIVTP